LSGGLVGAGDTVGLVEAGDLVDAPAGDTVDVLLVQLGSTEGLRVADEGLVASLRRAGAHVVVAPAARPSEIRTLMLTDLGWARAARRAAMEALAHLRGTPPRSVIYSTTTASLLWPLPGAIRFDSVSATNRPGRHGLWQRPLERRRLREAPLLLPSSAGALAEAEAAMGGIPGPERALVVPSPITSCPPGEGGPLEAAPQARGNQALLRSAPAGRAVGQPPDPAQRDIAAITYAANPHKKGLDRVLAAWRAVRRPDERLVIAGVGPERLRQLGFAADDEGVEVLSMLARDAYHAQLRRARVFICAPRREDYGLVQLEALAAGCQLVTTAAPGPYVALPLARQLDPRLVGEGLGVALRTALDSPREDYAMRAAALVEPFTAAAVDRVVAGELLPRLVRGGRF
jgi:glycosyltransferase involved in cell wall biosynthesis